MIALIPLRFRSKRIFQQHFALEHHFHGVQNHQIAESYYVLPKSKLAIQLFHNGIQFPYIDLHLQCKINKTLDQIQIDLAVNNPAVSKKIIQRIEQDLTNQLLKFQKLVTNDPRLNYVQDFCVNCHHNDRKPFTVCIKTCNYKAKE